ncbi:MAG TPA: AraC family transcriptional regulator [Ktedonobacter sp.]|nr:AraC family transcriptional regulator [Ktedonobacter sp.]
MKIQILLYNGFDELDAIAPFEVLRMATRHNTELHVEMVALDGTPEITAQNGLRIQVHAKLDSSADIVLVPGGGWVARSAQGAWAEAQHGTIPDALAHVYKEGKTLAAVCTGAMLLATAGLLRNRNATTHHNAIVELKELGAHLQDARVVDDGDILTSGGVTSGIDLALWLVERYYGARIAIAIERNLEYERRGVVWRQS